MQRLWIGFALLFTAVLAKPTLNVFVVSDFSLAFVPSSSYRSALSSGPFICPSSAYPNALAQFQFTSDVIAGVDSSIPLKIQYYVYSGGDGDPIGNVFSSRDNFTETSIPAYTKFCAEGPEENDFERFIQLTITPSVTTDLFILFTAASQAQIDKALPILSSNVNRVIVLGLNGSDASTAYRGTSVTLADFSHPERVSCLIDVMSDMKVTVMDPVSLCYPPNPTIYRITGGDYGTVPISNAIYGKCPGGMYPAAGNEFNFTVDVVNGIGADIDINLMFFEYRGGNEAVPFNMYSRENFANDASVILRDACLDDHYPSDLVGFSQQLQAIYANILVIFTAEQLYGPLPISNFDRIIIVGLNGIDESKEYPDSSISIVDFSRPEMVSCMIEAAYRGEMNLVKVCGQKRDPMTIVFINDFTTDFVGDFSIKKVSTSQSANGKCQGGAYPEVGNEFDFTINIVNGIRADADLMLMFSEYLGGFSLFLGASTTREQFPSAASNTLRDACFDDHELTNFDSLSTLLTFVHADVLVLFTALPMPRPLNIPVANFGRVIVVGLDGASEYSAYPDSFISITDFARPEVVSCMINRLWDDISVSSLLDCAK